MEKTTDTKHGLSQNRDDIVRILRERTSDLKRLGVKRLALFGSAARDHLTPASDIDIIVELSSPKYRNYMSVRRYLEDLLQRPVDLLTQSAIVGRLKQEVDRVRIDVATD